MEPLQIWGGVECTVNRVGNSYYNQLDRSGHAGRISDLDRIAGLGIRMLRYPILWELNAPDLDVRTDWRWAKERLNRLRELQIVPIVGLVHHGSGPAHTCLTDERFASGLAAYAGSVAARFPWVEWYTPVNEPLTTARFSGLYGLWYPHGRDNHTFARSLVNQCRATILSMQAIRGVNPKAKLLQTDDLGTTYSTPTMGYQAAFDNERRWLGWDLTCGRVGPDHPMRNFLLSSGIAIRELEWLREFACPPDMIGINHYVTSDRFLDERLDRYPSDYWGANSRERYADIDAVRIVQPPLASWSNSLRDAWGRYQLPVALTEVHLGCTREEQLRWFVSAWTAAQEARKNAIEVVAVTAWALFGSFNWDSLVTRDGGHYEPGIFDIRGPEPYPTALAHLVSELIHGQPSQNPVLYSPGWWQRSQRLLFGVHTLDGFDHRIEDSFDGTHERPLLVWGSGPVAEAFSRVCEERGLAHSICSPPLVEGDTEAIDAVIDRVNPWAMIYAESPVPNAHKESKACPLKTSARGRGLAAESARRGLPLLTFCLAAMDGRTFSARKERASRDRHRVVGCNANATGNPRASGDCHALCMCENQITLRELAQFQSATPPSRNAGEAASVTGVALSLPEMAALINTSLDQLIDRFSSAWHLTKLGVGRE
jgi:dTDP-4-dehydrorhamnose reductase